MWYLLIKNLVTNPWSDGKFSKIYNNMRINLKVMFLYVRFEAVTAVTMKSVIFWDVTPYSLVEAYRHFRGKYCIHIQDKRLSTANKQKGANGR
jgi:hypothetical protein